MSAPGLHCWRTIGVYGGDQSCEVLEQALHCRNCSVFQRAALTLLDREAPAESMETVAGPSGRRAERSALVFRLGSQWLGLPAARVAEVAPDEPVRLLAHRADGRLEGVVNVRGELHLCVALIELLALGVRASQRGAGARLVLLHDDRGTALAFRGDEVLGLQRFDAMAIEPPPDTLPPALQRCVSGLVRCEQRHVALLEDRAVLGLLEEALFR